MGLGKTGKPGRKKNSRSARFVSRFVIFQGSSGIFQAAQRSLRRGNLFYAFESNSTALELGPRSRPRLLNAEFLHCRSADRTETHRESRERPEDSSR